MPWNASPFSKVLLKLGHLYFDREIAQELHAWVGKKPRKAPSYILQTFKEKGFLDFYIKKKKLLLFLHALSLTHWH
jgi:hypothetical protein